MSNQEQSAKQGLDEQMQEQKIREGVAILQKACHAASKKSGWWTDIDTGDDLAAEMRNIKKRAAQERLGQKIGLIHSEVSEALEGGRKNKADEHLPHRKSVEVELADAIIRIGDLADALGLDLAGAIIEKMAYNADRKDHKIENRKLEGGKSF